MTDAAQGGALFRALATGHVTARAAGAYAATLPAGECEVRFGHATRRLTLADGADHALPADDRAWIAMTLAVAGPIDRPVVEATLIGAGPHRIALRLANAAASVATAEVTLAEGVAPRQRWALSVRIAT